MKTDEEFYDFLIALGMGLKYSLEFRQGSVFHYTSPQGLDGILFSGKNCIEFFASRFDCVNDTSEGKYIIDIYNEVVSELYKKQKITLKQYSKINNLLPSDAELIKQWQGEECISVREVPCQRYICCFSTDGDSLAMWNYYSKNSKYQGYNIEIYINSAKDSLYKYLSGITINWYEVLYNRDEQKKLIREFLSEVMEYYTDRRAPTIQETIKSQLGEWSMCFKHPCFYHEKEVRAVVYIPKESACAKLPIEYRQKDMFVIPFVRIKMDKECVSSVTISPLYCTDGEKMQQVQVMRERLDKNNYIADVSISKIPIRY